MHPFKDKNMSIKKETTTYTPNGTYIAVYGTLRKGFGNHRVLGDSTLVGTGKTVEKLKMTAAGIPFVTRNEEVSNITVEVYDVSDAQLPRVDGLEGYNPNNHEGSWYKRTPIQVMIGEDEVTASIYFGDKDAATVIASGDYADYSSF